MAALLPSVTEQTALSPYINDFQPREVGCEAEVRERLCEVVGWDGDNAAVGHTALLHWLWQQRQHVRGQVAGDVQGTGRAVA